MEIDRMRALLSALQEARFGGLRSVSYDTKTLTYGSDAELAAAIRDLEARIARASGNRWRSPAHHLPVQRQVRRSRGRI